MNVASSTQSPPAVLFFGERGPAATSSKRPSIRAVRRAARAGAVDALVVDARSPQDLFQGLALLRALFDNPESPCRDIHPHHVVALIADGDVEAAFALGRFGIAGVLEERRLSELDGVLVQALACAPEAAQPALLAPLRPTWVPAGSETDLPTVAVGYRHAPATLNALARYVQVLREHAGESTVFADVATLLEVMVEEGLTCQTNLAAKAGVTHTGQFIGSFEFYRQLRRTRYARIPDHPSGAIGTEVFIAVDEVIHEVLHLLFLANQLRTSSPPPARVAEELSLTWWQAVVHNRVFPEWLYDRHILEINDDFLLCEGNAESGRFWEKGAVFSHYANYPWVPYVIARLPERESYIGERSDLVEVIANFRSRPEAAFLAPTGIHGLGIDGPFDEYPRLPATLSLVEARLE